MKSQDIYAILYLLVIVALVIFVAYMVITGQYETLGILIIAAVVVIAIMMIAGYFIFGAYYAVKQRDKVHTDSGMSLEDVQEVDREMEEQ